MVDEEEGSESSADYPHGGMVEPFDMSRDEEIMRMES